MVVSMGFLSGRPTKDKQSDQDKIGPGYRAHDPQQYISIRKECHNYPEYTKDEIQASRQPNPPH
jgi:hypothetical protein